MYMENVWESTQGLVDMQHQRKERRVNPSESVGTMETTSTCVPVEVTNQQGSGSTKRVTFARVSGHDAKASLWTLPYA